MTDRALHLWQTKYNELLLFSMVTVNAGTSGQPSEWELTFSVINLPRSVTLTTGGKVRPQALQTMES